jgi:small subunit ribosomal protein S8
MLTDPIADMLTRIRNANLALHDAVVMPTSKLKVEIARLLEAEGSLTVRLKYDRDRRRVISGIKRISRPGRRAYADRNSIPRVLGGMGVAIVSTSQGLLTDQEARRRGVGGEIICTVW